MPKPSSKHSGRDYKVSVDSVHGGRANDLNPYGGQSKAHLDDLCNFKFLLGSDEAGSGKVFLRVREGTTDETEADNATKLVTACYFNSTICGATASGFYEQVAGVNTLRGSLSGIGTFCQFNDKLIISDGGITKAWNGTTFEILNCLYEDETLDTNQGIFCSVGYTGTGTRVMTSPDGSTWTTRTNAVANEWYAVCWSPERGLFCAVSITGTGNRVMTSPDGITWTSRTSAADNDWYAICWSPELGLFCAVAETGTGNRVMTSSDGITWTIRTSAADNSWKSICWSPDLTLFCAVSASGTGNRVMTSPDGITWTSRTSAADNNWFSVCWSPELTLFCAVASSGTGNRVMTSPDGVTWTTRTSAADNDWRGVCWSPELRLFCAVASTGSGDQVMTSPDGITWTSRADSVYNFWRAVCWSSDLSLFCAVAPSGTGNRVMTSPDGITWTTRESAADNSWNSVCYGETVKKSGTLEHPPVEPSTIHFNFYHQDVADHDIYDDGNGRLTGSVDSDATFNISGVSNAAACEITATGHTFQTGEIINLQAIDGASDLETALNNKSFTITVTGTNTFTVPVDTSAMGAYSSGGTASGNAIKYATGEYTFVCDAVPDDNTDIVALSYEKDEGAPKSTFGFVRNNRLYLGGDPDNPSRLYICGTNDEDAWDTSSGGYWFDVDPKTGGTLIGGVNFYQIAALLKTTGIHRMVSYPGYSDNIIEPVFQGAGCIARRGYCSDGNFLYYLCKEGIAKISPTERYGDIQRVLISKQVGQQVKDPGNSLAYCAYSEGTGQIFLTFYDTVAGALKTVVDVYDVALGLWAQYAFAFTHIGFNQDPSGTFYICGNDGRIYSLNDQDTQTHRDGSSDYSSTTYIKSSWIDLGYSNNEKLNKRINLKLLLRNAGVNKFSATLNIYINRNTDEAVFSVNLTQATHLTIPAKFPFREVRYELVDVLPEAGTNRQVDFYGIEFEGALQGVRYN